MKIIKWVGAFALASLVWPAYAADKPNILVIFTDDKGQYPPSKEELEKVYKHSIGKCVNPEYDAFK